MSVNTRVFYREISNVGTVGNARVRVARRERPRTSRGDTDSRVPTHVFIEFRALRAYITRVDQREKDRLRIHLGEDGANIHSFILRRRTPDRRRVGVENGGERRIVK